MTEEKCTRHHSKSFTYLKSHLILVKEKNTCESCKEDFIQDYCKRGERSSSTLWVQGQVGFYSQRAGWGSQWWKITKRRH